MHKLIQESLDAYEVIAPVRVSNQIHFRPISGADEIVWDYSSSCFPPSKILYHSRRDLLRYNSEPDSWKVTEVEPETLPRILLGVHPCDLHGLLVLDRTLLGTFKDPWYETVRRNTVIIGLNCQQVCKTCFCASFGTGPFFHEWMGQGPPDGGDLLLTDLGGEFMVETMSDRGREFLSGYKLKKAGEADKERKQELENEALDRFEKTLDTSHLPELLLRNLEHPVWERVGEGRCLSCTNCTMVCPTCYCYDVTDETTMDGKSGVRYRRWDSCQDQHFAKVHYGNYRPTRKSRLRQFVCHKLSYWVEQHGCFGCTGCGRCMYWCPTNIDLAEIATEIREDETR